MMLKCPVSVYVAYGVNKTACRTQMKHVGTPACQETVGYSREKVKNQKYVCFATDMAAFLA